MDNTNSVRSACRLCMGGCTISITLENGKPVKIEGHPEGPSNKGSLCKIGQASLDLLSNPERLAHPLKRVGERGEGKWQQITWDEALDLAPEPDLFDLITSAKTPNKSPAYQLR